MAARPVSPNMGGPAPDERVQTERRDGAAETVRFGSEEGPAGVRSLRTIAS